MKTYLDSEMSKNEETRDKEIKNQQDMSQFNKQKG